MQRLPCPFVHVEKCSFHFISHLQRDNTAKAQAEFISKNANSHIGFNPQEKEPLIIINCKQLMAQFYLHTSKIPPSVAEEIHGVERPQKRSYVRPKLSSDKDAKADAYCEEERESSKHLTPSQNLQGEFASSPNLQIHKNKR
jgi:hypothetical protein